MRCAFNDTSDTRHLSPTQEWEHTAGLVFSPDKRLAFFLTALQLYAVLTKFSHFSPVSDNQNSRHLWQYYSIWTTQQPVYMMCVWWQTKCVQAFSTCTILVILAVYKNTNSSLYEEYELKASVRDDPRWLKEGFRNSWCHVQGSPQHTKTSHRPSQFWFHKKPSSG